MRDVSEYLRRVVMAVFLCPVAVVFMLTFGFSGFSPGEFMHFFGLLGQFYTSMDAGGHHALLSQGLFSWAVLGFVFVLVSYVVNPPSLSGSLKEIDASPAMSVVE